MCCSPYATLGNGATAKGHASGVGVVDRRARPVPLSPPLQAFACAFEEGYNERRAKRRGDIMNKRLLAGLAAVSFLAGGGGTAALAGVGAPAAAASTAAVVSSTSKWPNHGPLESLVAQGTITKAQAIAIHNALVTYVRGHWRSALDAVLSPLVKAHTISQSQANAVMAAFAQRM
jgi:hypothetical protein